MKEFCLSEPFSSKGLIPQPLQVIMPTSHFASYSNWMPHIQVSAQAQLHARLSTVQPQVIYPPVRRTGPGPI